MMYQLLTVDIDFLAHPGGTAALQMMPRVKPTEEAVTEHTSELVVPRDVTDTLIPEVPSDLAIY